MYQTLQIFLDLIISRSYITLIYATNKNDRSQIPICIVSMHGDGEWEGASSSRDIRSLMEGWMKDICYERPQKSSNQ